MPTTLRVISRRTFCWLLALVVAFTLFGASTARATDGSRGPAPTVVLVHGAWADSSSWAGVVGRLQRRGYGVRVFPTPLRSLAGDSSALRQFLGTVPGPVVLVGHSYGGAVITDAATGDPQVKALVYVDAFAPRQGEAVQQLAGPTSVLANPDPSQVFSFVPDGPPPTTDLYVLPDVFVNAFANDLPPRRGRVLAATQRPVTAGALAEPSSTPAWVSIPSWYAVGTRDKVIPPSAQLEMARRIGAHISTAPTGHLPMISAPAQVTRVIITAAKTVA